MPRAVSDRFIRAHQPSAKAGSSKERTADGAAPGAGAVHNPIFNTERFGQHILKNPLVAQGCVPAVLHAQMRSELIKDRG
jgi:18S rRNA (adenine1779-N6/adenine1780-N6)-dimethyltransferase